MGLNQGQAAREAAQAVYQAFLDGPELELARPRLVPRRLFPRLAQRRAARAMAPALIREYPEQVARMQGIAAGSGIPLEGLYMGLSAELLLNRVHWVHGACSALGVTGQRTTSGEALIAKNFDYPPRFRVGFCVRRSTPADGLASLDVTVAPLAGCHSGVNEAGLAVTYNYGRGQDESGAPLPISLLTQRLLERCRTVDEAAELAARTPRSGGALLTVADAAGALAVLELSPTQFARRDAEDGQVACTNHYETALRGIDVPHHARYGRRSIRELVGQRVHASSEARRAELSRECLAGSPFDAAGLIALLSSHGVSGAGSDDTLCRHGDYYATTCSVVLLPAQRALRVCFGFPCQRTYAEHALRIETPSGAGSIPA
jgi:hypothetical protein